MFKVKNGLPLSKVANSVKDLYSTPNEFKSLYEKLHDSEKDLLIRHFVINNLPFVFKDKPLLFERIRQYLAIRLEISPIEVLLIGSAKTGYSISPSTYGKEFGQHSDMDFSVINENLFSKLETEFKTWAYLFTTNSISASNDNENKYWTQNLSEVPKKLSRGFIDTHLIPNRELFVTTKRINQTLFLLHKNLLEGHELNCKKASIRIYKNWETFLSMVSFNTNSVMKGL